MIVTDMLPFKLNPEQPIEKYKQNAISTRN